MGYTFEWNRETAEANVKKHGVTFDEASTVSGDPLAMLMADPDHSAGERRCLLLRVRTKIGSHSGASAGRADARRRDAGDVVTSSRSGNAADARPPPRPEGLPIVRHLFLYRTSGELWGLPIGSGM